MIHRSALSLVPSGSHIDAAKVPALSEPETKARLVLIDEPERAPAAPRRRDAGFGIAGWLASAAVHAAVIAAAIAGLPLIQPIPVPTDDMVVDVVFAPSPSPSGDSSIGREIPPPVPPEPELATAEAPLVETTAMPPSIEDEPPPPEPTTLPPAPSEVAAAEPSPAPPPIAEAPPPEPVMPPPVSAPQIVPEPPLPRPPKPRPKFASAPAHVAQSPQSVAEAPAAAAAAPTPAAAPAAQSLAAVPIIPPQPVAGAATNRKPDYPAEARRRRLQGEVLLRVNVSTAGAPEEIAVLTSSGYAMLDDAAIAAVRHWRFHPATQGELPVAAPANVPIRFRLED